MNSASELSTLPISQVATKIEASCGIQNICRSCSGCAFQGSTRPLYCLEFFKTNVQANNWQLLNEKRPLNAMENLDWNFEDLKTFLLALKAKCFQKSVPSCAVKNVKGYTEIDADQYLVYWDEENKKCVGSLIHSDVSLSLKIAVISDQLGNLAGLVTFHVSN